MQLQPEFLCKCNSEGVQKVSLAEENGSNTEYCWLAEGRNKTTCVLANGKVASDISNTWCEYQGSDQLHCHGNI